MGSLFFGMVLCLAIGFGGNNVSAEEERLINGNPVAKGTYREVIQINSDGASCGATLVGPRALLTSAHCVQTGGTVTFTLDGSTFDAEMTRSPLYPRQDHDLAVGIVSKEVPGITPAILGGKASEGVGINLLGYGCTNPDGTGGNDGILRIGDTVVTSLVNHTMISRKADGAALCFKDSGGPAFLEKRGNRFLLGIGSTGNIKDTNHHTRTDVSDTTDFLRRFAQEKNIVICGINSACGGKPPVKPKPTCVISATPNPATLGQIVTLAMSLTGEVTTAKIEQVSVAAPAYKLNVSPQGAGNYVGHGMVEGPGGSNTCETNYLVKAAPEPPPKPTCTLTANPTAVKLGQEISLQLKSIGEVTSATIDESTVSFPSGTKKALTTKTGSFTSIGTVTGPGGTGSCTARYQVSETPEPPAPAPELAVVPAYCGKNTIPETHVITVCLAVLKKPASPRHLVINEALIVTYSDNSKEVTPIIYRKNIPGTPGDIQVKEDLWLYANGAVTLNDYLLLDTRHATLTKLPLGRYGEIPSGMEGHTAKGSYFKVDKLTALSEFD